MMGEIDPGCRIVAIDPYFTHARLLLNNFLDIGEDVIYLDCSVLDELGTSLSSAIQEFYNGHLPDLQSIRFILLDHIDSVVQSDLVHFLKAGLQELNTLGRFVLFGRRLPYDVLHDANLEPIAQILPSVNHVRHNELSASRHQIIVHAFNGGRVLVDGRSVEDWGGALPYNLFFYLVDKGMVKRQDIFDTFWPGFTNKEATNVFHVTKRKVRKILYDVDIYKYNNGFYRISPDVDVYYDVMHFTQLVQDANVAEGDRKIALLEQAVQLVHNRFLHTADEAWIVERRQQLEYALSDLLIDLADSKRKAGQLNAALGLCARALSMNDAREDVIMRIMELYLEIGMPADALSAYNLVEKRLVERYGIPPGRALRELADEAAAMLDGSQQDEPEDDDGTEGAASRADENKPTD
ncbi:hypothetical protein G4Y79_17310 [Phototrophicus methaneseepsis]|uniref:Bacterial transcriptional activator domain-containing protein n=1 Tax=Phototrophicus methaneseepsis TaxID=2710758 RepID=A0A7S8E6W1_9CHLR|nr:bacterial transcriptional activator domain-containing protein [Phototrophicus methaneseepsis]QPC81440.1 hypothetical protein G4Y79_17310 [Phototrophicus methaneseepsis]